ETKIGGAHERRNCHLPCPLASAAAMGETTGPHHLFGKVLFSGDLVVCELLGFCWARGLVPAFRNPRHRATGRHRGRRKEDHSWLERLKKNSPISGSCCRRRPRPSPTTCPSCGPALSWWSRDNSVLTPR